MSRRLLVLFFLILTLSLRAQRNIPLHAGIRFAPFQLIEFYNGASYRGGLDLEIGPRWGLTLEAGGYFRNFNGLKDIRGFQVDGGIKCYLSPERDNSFYILLNSSYRESGFNFGDSIANNPNYYQEYRIEKYITCLNLSFGEHARIKDSRFFIDYWAGLGVRFRNVHASIPKEILIKGIEYSDSQAAFFMFTPGKAVWPNATVGFRIGFRLF